MSDHEEIESSVAAWVLGALDAEEADSVRSHAEGCPTCREVAGRLRRVVGALPLVVDQDMSGAQASVIDLKTDGLALVDFRGLPPPGGGRVYEVWLIPRQGNPVPAAVFVPDSNGSRVVLVNQSLKGYTLMAVTNEAGPDGAQAPTEPPPLYGSLDWKKSG